MVVKLLGMLLAQMLDKNSVQLLLVRMLLEILMVIQMDYLREMRMDLMMVDL